MKLNLTIEECLAFADEWGRGLTVHEGSQGWRVVCMLLAEEVRRLRDELQEADALRDKMGGILTRTANALRGDPPPLHLHSWHDLPERVTAAMNALQGAMELASANVCHDSHDSDCATHNEPAYPNGPCDCSKRGDA